MKPNLFFLVTILFLKFCFAHNIFRSKRDSVSVRKERTQMCPDTVTKFMPDGQTQMCAAIYREEYCAGTRLPIEIGNVTMRLNGNWFYEISSVEMNPNCTLKICRSSNLEGTCTHLNGEKNGRNYNELPAGYNNYIASLACACEEKNSVAVSTTTRMPLTPTTNVFLSTCPTIVTRYMPNGIRPLCATVYKNRQCGGPALQIEAGNITNRLNSDWFYEISSVKLNPGCEIKMCNSPNFDGQCRNFTGSQYGYDLIYHDFDNDAWSLACTCKEETIPVATTPTSGTCPTAMDRYMPDGRRAVCAAVFQETNCQGSRLAVEDGNVTMRLNDQWYDKISSIQINPNCIMKVCGLPYLESLCTNMTGGILGRNYAHMPPGFNNYITSFSCFCDNDRVITTTNFPATTTMASTTPASKSSYRYRIGNTLPSFIPNQFNVPTCAVFMKGILQPEASSYWIEEQVARHMPASLAGVSSFNYISTAVGCNLLYCNNTDLTGQCGTVNPDRFKFFFDGFRVNSFLCDCH